MGFMPVRLIWYCRNFALCRASDISRKKKAKFRGIFRGKFLGKSADFCGNFGAKLRQETISKKQPISLGFWGQISLKSINFALI